MYRNLFLKFLFMYAKKVYVDNQTVDNNFSAQTNYRQKI